MSTMTTEAVLVKQTKYRVQDVTRFPKDNRKHLIGKDVLFLEVNGSTAEVRYASSKHSIPVRSLVHVKGFTAKAVHSKNADGFVVIAQNALKIEVGTAYLNPIGVTEEHAVFEVNGKTVKLPLIILASLVRDKVIIPKEVKKAAKKSGISPELVATLDHPEIRKDLDGVPSLILKLLPNININDVKDVLYNKDDVFSDYNGEPHSSLMEADKANTIIRHKLLEEKLVELVALNVKNEFDAVRQEELCQRK